MQIKIAHDYTCPYCWIGWNQAQILIAEYGVTVDWVGYELYPDNLELPAVHPPIVAEKGILRTPTRFEFALAASNTPKPRYFHDGARIHNALEATEYAKQQRQSQPFVDRLYRALWIEGLDINSIPVLSSLAEGILKDPQEMVRAIECQEFKDRIVEFDEPAYESGVHHVPTFWIGDKGYAEQPMSVLIRAIKSLQT